METPSAELCSCRRNKHVVAFCQTKICPTRNNNANNNNSKMCVKQSLPWWRCWQHRTCCLAMVISEPGLEARSLCQVIALYAFEIKFSGRHRGFDSVLFNL